MKNYLLFLILFSLVGCATLSTDKPENEVLPESQDNETVDDPLKLPGYEPPKSVSEAIKRGYSALLENDHKKALFEYSQGLILLADPETSVNVSSEEKVTLYAQLAELNYSLGNFNEALIATNSILQVDNKNIRGHELAGILHLKNRSYAMAEQHFNESIRLDKERITENNMTNKPDAKSPFYSYTGLGLISDLNKNFEKAELNFQNAITVKPRSPQAYTNLAYSYYLSGDYSNAHRYVRKALSYDAGYVQAWRNLGMLYVVQNHEIEAIKAFMKIEKDYEAYNDIGYVYQMISNEERAKYFFNKSIDNIRIYLIH